MLDPNSILLTPRNIGKRIAQNRFVAQPMEGNDALDHAVSERAIARYAKLAQGKWGVIVIEALAVQDDALARKNQMVISREHLSGFKALVAAMKEADPNVLVLFQITHSGRKSGKDFSRPTALYAPQEHEHFLDTEEIEEIQRLFIEAALISEEAGADGVDFKLCHGYFGCEMLRPANIRNDKFGGSFENRTRFLAESIPEIRRRLSTRTSSWEAVFPIGKASRVVAEQLACMKQLNIWMKWMSSFG